MSDIFINIFLSAILDIALPVIVPPSSPQSPPAIQTTVPAYQYGSFEILFAFHNQSIGEM